MAAKTSLPRPARPPGSDPTPSDKNEPSSSSLAQALAGRERKAREALTLLAKAADERHVSPFHFARLYAALGETDAALDALTKAAKERGVLAT